MEFLKKKILELRPDFEKGGKYAQFHTLFDGFATFLFTPDRVSRGGTHIKAGIDLKRTMFFVILAMIPSLLLVFSMWVISISWLWASLPALP